MQTHSSEIYDGYDAHHSAGVASTRPSRSNLIQLNAGDGSRAIERTPDRGDLISWSGWCMIFVLLEAFDKKSMQS